VSNLVNLPASQARIPEPPASLHEGLERDCWLEVVPELVRRKIWDTDLKDMVQAYCVQRARFMTANEKVQELGLIQKSKRGDGKFNPYISISNAAYDRMVRLATELGLTAARRESAKKVDKPVGIAADKFLKRNAAV
jgi:P27 family predicted phage terminase small subunit